MPFFPFLPADWNETLMAQTGAATLDLQTEAPGGRSRGKKRPRPDTAEYSTSPDTPTSGLSQENE